ncbi:hypothetical protein [Streptomyces sp. STR69]|uniref:hypothetical protein n=1 Tax=Streptomyces sp. STR69 TaxID=1796942 RepID=UPI0021C91695|nr:hypothetical protein [Streptomyces sp. STR69]
MTPTTHVRRTAVVTGAARGIGAAFGPPTAARTASFLVGPGAGFVSRQVIRVAGGPVD